MKQAHKIQFLHGRYAVSRLGAHADISVWLNGSGFQAVIRADDELTIVCLEDRVPIGVGAEKSWTCLRTIGPFPFDAAGIRQSLIAPLTANGIGIFVVCTYDGEHVLLPARETENASTTTSGA